MILCLIYEAKQKDNFLNINFIQQYVCSFALLSSDIFHVTISNHSQNCEHFQQRVDLGAYCIFS